MIVEITGTHFQNKGAELMLAAISHELLKNGHTPAILPWSGSFNQRARYGLHQIMWYQRYKIPWSKFPTPFSKRLRRQYGLIRQKDVDYVFDASGFKYSDQWGASTINEALKVYRKLKKDGTKLIMMPQAFGPFENESVRSLTEEILSYAEVIYARDKKSLGYLNELNVDKSKIKEKPDFTLLLKGSVPDIPLVKSIDPLACIVPNYRMIDKYFDGDEKLYTQLMVKSVNAALNNNFSPYILIHERGTDKELAENIKRECSDDIPIIYNDKPIEIKGLIGVSGLFIGSRFHGLVSALSQGVPALGTGWSHKYQMLFDDFKCPEYLIDPEKDDVDEKLNQLINDKSLPDKLLMASGNIRKEVLGMWDEIFNIMSNK